MSSEHMTIKMLSERTGLSRTKIFQLARLIEKHPNRYGIGVIRGKKQTLINYYALLDALNYEELFDEGEEQYLEPFRPSLYIGGIR